MITRKEEIRQEILADSKRRHAEYKAAAQADKSSFLKIDIDPATKDFDSFDAFMKTDEPLKF